MDVLNDFLFPKIDVKRDIIRAKIWFPSGKRWLANNMTGQADVRFPRKPKKQRSKKKNKITPDLRLQSHTQFLLSAELFDCAFLTYAKIHFFLFSLFLESWQE